MIPIETTIAVAPDGKATVELSSKIVPGVHKVLLIVEEKLISDRPIINYTFAWDEFEQLIDKSTVDTGIADMAHQHDRYFLLS